MQKFLIVIVVLALFLEGSVTSLPLVLMTLLLFSIQVRSVNGFAFAFIAGIILDVFLVRPLGESSVYFLIVLFLLRMYEKKYEVNSLFFMTISTMVASAVYFLIFPVPGSLLQIIIITLLGGFLFMIFHLKKVKKQASFSHL